MNGASMGQLGFMNGLFRLPAGVSCAGGCVLQWVRALAAGPQGGGNTCDTTCLPGAIALGRLFCKGNLQVGVPLLGLLPY